MNQPLPNIVFWKVPPVGPHRNDKVSKFSIALKIGTFGDTFGHTKHQMYVQMFCDTFGETFLEP